MSPDNVGKQGDREMIFLQVSALIEEVNYFDWKYHD